VRARIVRSKGDESGEIGVIGSVIIVLQLFEEPLVRHTLLVILNTMNLVVVADLAA